MTSNLTKVRVGVIGVGIGKAHLTGYSSVPEAEVVAVCDLDENRAKSVLQQFDFDDVKIYTDYHELLANPDIDAVSVCLPNFLHRPIAVDALEAGKHVICEKPLSTSVEEAQKIADAAARSGQKFMVGMVNRFRDDSQYLKNFLTEDKLGDIYYAHCGVLRRSGIPGYGGWFTTKSKSGGGPLIDVGVHLLDLTWWLAGAPKPISVSGTTYAKFGPRKRGVGAWGRAGSNPEGTFDVEDMAAALIRFENGLTINLEVSWALYLKENKQWSNLYGTEGGAAWGSKEGIDIISDINGAPANTQISVPAGNAWAGEMQHFINSIIHDIPSDPGADQGLTIIKILEGIYRSAETKQEVFIS